MFRSAVVFAACSVVAFAGCGGPAKNSTVPTVPVNGKLTVDGKPFGSCSITFVPADASPSKKSATAIVAPDGSFSLRTFKDGDGAPEGTYTILLVADAIDPKPIPETKPKTFDVKKPAAGGTLEMTVDLEGTGKSTNPLLPPTP